MNNEQNAYIVNMVCTGLNLEHPSFQIQKGKLVFKTE